MNESRGARRYSCLADSEVFCFGFDSDLWHVLILAITVFVHGIKVKENPFAIFSDGF